jgi:hypothetical protein
MQILNPMARQLLPLDDCDKYDRATLTAWQNYLLHLLVNVTLFS